MAINLELDLSIISNSKDLHLLEKIYDVIHSNQSQKIYQRQLEKNLENDSTWFYLNKQAAFDCYYKLKFDIDSSQSIYPISNYAFKQPIY